MPKVKTSRNRAPVGFELVEPTLNDLERRMRDVEQESHEGKRKNESLWPVFRIHHQRSRYIYEMFHKKHLINREVYDYCINNGYADANLIAKWKKPGYERLCCLRCIQTSGQNYGTTCICRVPKKDLEEGKIIRCSHCGCTGCSTVDVEADAESEEEEVEDEGDDADDFAEYDEYAEYANAEDEANAGEDGEEE